LVGMAVAGALSSPALSQGDPASGEQVFRQCSSCHTFDPDQRRPGPHLQGLFGRTAGSVEGFRYSQAMVASNIVWDQESLSTFLVDPRAVVPGTSMAVGLRNEEDLDDLLAFLQQQGG